MATTRKQPTLPTMTVARVEVVAKELERAYEQNVDLFIEAGQRYAERYREGTSRPLDAAEAAQIASAVLDDERLVEERAAAFQQSELRAHDAPQSIEILAAGGMSTAAAFMAAGRRMLAVIEMPEEVFEAAFDNDSLEQAIKDALAETRHVEFTEARERASAAMTHFAKAMGDTSGEGLGLLVRSVWQALKQAAATIQAGTPAGSALSLSTPSAASTADSPDRTSSTNSATGTPSSSPGSSRPATSRPAASTPA